MTERAARHFSIEISENGQTARRDRVPGLTMSERSRELYMLLGKLRTSIRNSLGSEDD